MAEPARLSVEGTAFEEHGLIEKNPDHFRASLVRIFHRF